MISTNFLLDTAGWTWIVVIAGLIVGGYFFFDKLMCKGIYDESRAGGSLINSAFSELQTLVDPAHRYVIEERERKRREHDDAGDDPEPST